MKKPLALSALLLMSSVADAGLILEITEGNAVGTTKWTFSGSATAGGAGYFDYSGNLGSADVWSDIGSYTEVGDFENTSLTGNAFLSVGADTRDINMVYIDDDSGVDNDDIGVGISGDTLLSFAAGDTVSWGGELFVTGISLADLSESGLPFSYTGSTYGGQDGTLELTVNIGSGATSVPAPATAFLFCASLLGVAASSKRKKS